jgi:hypothetical protein
MLKEAGTFGHYAGASDSILNDRGKRSRQKRIAPTRQDSLSGLLGHLKSSYSFGQFRRMTIENSLPHGSDITIQFYEGHAISQILDCDCQPHIRTTRKRFSEMNGAGQMQQPLPDVRNQPTLPSWIAKWARFWNTRNVDYGLVVSLHF